MSYAHLSARLREILDEGSRLVSFAAEEKSVRAFFATSEENGFEQNVCVNINGDRIDIDIRMEYGTGTDHRAYNKQIAVIENGVLRFLDTLNWQFSADILFDHVLRLMQFFSTPCCLPFRKMFSTLVVVRNGILKSTWSCNADDITSCPHCQTRIDVHDYKINDSDRFGTISRMS